MSDLDNLLDMNLDDLADLPEFAVFPVGAYRVTLAIASKKIGEHPAVEVGMKLLEVAELADPASTAPEVGATTSVAYMMDNQFGQGNLKAVLAPIGQAIGAGNLKAICEKLNGAEVIAVLKTRQNKEKTQTYQEIVSLNLV